MNATTASVLIAAIMATVLFVTIITVTATFRRLLAIMSDSHRHAIERRDDQVRSLLDRLMTIKWEDFVTSQALQEEPQEGGFLSPEEQRREASEAPTVVIEEAGRWGPLSRAARHEELSRQEQELLDEDFPEEVTSEGR